MLLFDRVWRAFLLKALAVVLALGAIAHFIRQALKERNQ
jgi:hypothetical protein